jgi:hypothetical protein
MQSNRGRGKIDEIRVDFLTRADPLKIPGAVLAKVVKPMQSIFLARVDEKMWIRIGRHYHLIALPVQHRFPLFKSFRQSQ